MRPEKAANFYTIINVFILSINNFKKKYIYKYIYLSIPIVLYSRKNLLICTQPSQASINDDAVY